MTDDRTDEETRDRASGMPGDGAGRREEPGHTGVYPFSEAPTEAEDAPVRTGAEWGQGAAGPAGYEDSGSSEVIPPGDQDTDS